MTRSRAPIVFVAAMLAVTALYLFGPLDEAPVFNAIGAAAALALVVGARRNAGARRAPWYLFAAGQALFVAGDVIAYNWPRFFGGELPFPSLADAFYLAVYPSLVAGLLLLVRKRGPRDRGSLIDSLIVTIGVAALSWIYLIAPYAHDATLSLPTKLISVAYPLMDLLVLGVAVRLAVGGARRSPALLLLGLGTCALLATDAVYGWLLLHGGYEPGGLLDGGWAVFYALFGAAALHPSMRDLSRRAPDSAERLTATRLAILAVTSLVGPAVIIVRALLGQPVDVAVMTSASALIFGLVLARMAGVVRRHQEAVRREAALRAAGEALVGAGSHTEIARAARAAASAVTGAPAGVRLYVPDAAPGAHPDAIVQALADLPETMRAGAAEHGAGVVREREVDALGAHGPAWASPLRMRDRLRGVLVVLPGSRMATRTQEGLGALAAQVALALDSLALTEDRVRRQSEARLGALVQHASDAILIVDADGRLRWVSPSAETLFTRPAAALIGEPLAALVHADDAAAVGGSALIDASVAAEPDVSAHAMTPPRRLDAPGRIEFRVPHATDGWHHVEAVSTNLLDNEHVEGIVLNLRDISERKAFEARLEHQAFHDDVTGLPNRALFGNRVEHALERRRRDGVELAVLFLDLDDFKTVNDSLGHAAGDTLLREIGRRLQDCVRGADTAARLGGDEFAVLVEEIPDELHAVGLGERLMAAVAAPFVIGDRELTVRASVGIAFGDAGVTGADAAEKLLRNADAAMYTAKEQGKGRYQVFEPQMHASALDRLDLKTDLARALDADEFTLRYQPIVNLDTREMAGVEALVRWEHPVRGLVSPADFIPLAEDTGLIVPLGRQILLDACRQAATLQALTPDAPLSMSVNLSARQLQGAELVDDVRAALDASGIDPATLVLELTETLMMQDMDLAILRLHQLRELGVRLAIDDFGTGYSSLNSIRAFPIDLLKIDKSFLGDGVGEAAVPALTAAILDLASILDLRPVAEGIETEAQLERLRELGCPFGQGYHFARPMTGAEVEALAARGPAWLPAPVAI